LRKFIFNGVSKEADAIRKFEADDVILFLLHIRKFKVGHPVLSKPIDVA
jgi:hypothetical protein